MMNYLATLSYVGTRYHGFQVQDNAPTVQGAFQDALAILFGSRPDIKGCSRTDSGVHANKFCASFHAEKRDLRVLARSLNGLLPDDIRVIDLSQVPDDFHARYSCLGKRYIYLVSDAPVMSPFYLGRALDYGKPLDCDMLDRAAKVFCGTHDFGGFCSAKGKKDDCVRTVSDFSVSRSNGLVVFSVTADGFLYNMVRIMAGTLLSVAQNKLSSEDIARLLSTPQRSRLAFTAPAHALYLDEVFYDFGE